MKLPNIRIMPLLVLLTVLTGALIVRVVVAPLPRPLERLILDAQACLAAARFGLVVHYLDKDRVCETQAETDYDLHWVNIGKLSINRDHLIATEEMK